jgi:hypothetical protein
MARNNRPRVQVSAITVRVSAPLRTALERRAKADNRSVSNLVQTILQEAMGVKK